MKINKYFLTLLVDLGFILVAWLFSLAGTINNIYLSVILLLALLLAYSYGKHLIIKIISRRKDRFKWVFFLANLGIVFGLLVLQAVLYGIIKIISRPEFFKQAYATAFFCSLILCYIFGNIFQGFVLTKKFEIKKAKGMILPLIIELALLIVLQIFYSPLVILCGILANGFNRLRLFN